MSKTTVTDPRPALRVNLAATLVYLGYRVLGASKEHAWERARAQVVEAVIDKAVETLGVADPRVADLAGVQAFLEGGPLNGTVHFVGECGVIAVPQKDRPSSALQHCYRRTERTRGAQTVFEYRGLKPAIRPASDLAVAA